MLPPTYQINTFKIICFGIVIFISSLFSVSTFAQGCSDAGFCTVGALKPTTNQPETTKKNSQSITFLSPVGQGDENVFVWTPGLQYDYFTQSGWNLQGRITSNYASGNLGSVFGAGDVILSASRTKAIKGNWKFTPTLGVKIPLSQSNISSGGMPLPMQYQSSLGTFDLLAGITFSEKKWQFSAGYQQPLSGENKNGFLPEFWNGKPEANNYPPTFRFNRKGDVLLRATRIFAARNNFIFNAGLLGIYHLGEDKFTNPFDGKRVMAIDGSVGLTLNVTGAAYWQAGKRTRVGLSAGVPLVVRDVRPDGLTRSWVVSPEFSWTF
jgi:hypothetical protein